MNKKRKVAKDWVEYYSIPTDEVLTKREKFVNKKLGINENVNSPKQ